MRCIQASTWFCQSISGEKDDGGELHIRQHRFDVARLDHTV